MFEPESPSSDFAFAVASNHVNFFDTIMQIEILPDFSGFVSKPEPDDSLRNRKRRCYDPPSNANGHEDVKDYEPSSSMEYSGVQVRTVHINSPILSAKSPFFYKLLSNRMRESEQRHVTLQIQASEEDALMDLLNFIYCNTLPRTTPTALLDVLMAAGKFEVASCMIYCSRLLCTLPMTCESALLYLDLPSTVLMADTVQQLTDAAKQFLATHFKKYQEEVLNLPLAGIEAVLSSDDLQVASEDAIYDFVVKWAQIHYPKLEERREILGKRLLRFVRLPCMTCRKLKEVLTCGDIDPELASKDVLDALFFKAGDNANASFPPLKRLYKYRPMKMVEFESPQQQCIVYLDLKREECRQQLFPSRRIYSQVFHLGGQEFFLLVNCNKAKGSFYHYFRMYLGVQEKGSTHLTVDYEFAARIKPFEDFVSLFKEQYKFMGVKGVLYHNVFEMPWAAFVAKDSRYFINGVFHLRAELKIKK